MAGACSIVFRRWSVRNERWQDQISQKLNNILQQGWKNSDNGLALGLQISWEILIWCFAAAYEISINLEKHHQGSTDLT